MTYTKFYLIVHIIVGIFIIGFELFYRWITETYQINIRKCTNIFYIEFIQLNKIQSLNWFEKISNSLTELFDPIYDQCVKKELKLNANSIFFYLRYIWLTISSFYSCMVLKRSIVLK